MIFVGQCWDSAFCRFYEAIPSRRSRVLSALF